MAFAEVHTENADLDLSSEVTVLTDTPSATLNMTCFGWVAFGDGTKDLDGSGGDFILEVSVGGQTIQPVQTVTFNSDVRAAVFTAPFPVPANSQVLFKVTSPNAGDSDVDVTAKLFDAQPIALPDAAADAAGGLPISDAGGLDLDAKIGALTYTTANQVDVRVVSMETDTLTADALAADAGSEIAALVETHIVNEGDATAVLQAIADKVAADWVAGDASPLAIVAALKADAEWSSLTAIASALTTAQGDITSILQDTGTTLPAQIVSALSTDTYEELSSLPDLSSGNGASIKDMLVLCAMTILHKLDITSSTKEIHTSDGTVLGTKSLSDDGTTYSEAKIS